MNSLNIKLEFSPKQKKFMEELEKVDKLWFDLIFSAYGLNPEDLGYRYKVIEFWLQKEVSKQETNSSQ